METTVDDSDPLGTGDPLGNATGDPMGNVTSGPMGTATSDTMGIGELARRTGLTPEGIRFYERAGLLPPPGRVGGRRRYTAADAERLVAIRLCRAAGFTLDEVRRILQRTGEWRPVVRTKLAQIEHQMVLLAAVRDALQEALDCDHDDPMECPYFRARLRTVDPTEPEADVRTGGWHDDEPDVAHAHHPSTHRRARRRGPTAVAGGT